MLSITSSNPVHAIYHHLWRILQSKLDTARQLVTERQRTCLISDPPKLPKLGGIEKGRERERGRDRDRERERDTDRDRGRERERAKSEQRESDLD